MDLFSWERLFKYFPTIFEYLPVTLKIVLFGEIFGIALALIIALVRIRNVPIFDQIFGVYVSFMRGTPMLVQMLIVYYGLPELLKLVSGIDINSWDKTIFVIITFMLNQGAFLSEIFRSSILSVPVEQSEAAYSVGLTKWQTSRRIVLPQAAKVAIPSFGVDFVALFQSASLAFLIGVIDVMGRAKSIGASSGHYLEGYLIVAIIFLVISLGLKGLFSFLDKKVNYTT